jgi:putative aldouronate transport system permease protein
LNELRSQRKKALVQGISYLPYFLSWVVVFGVMNGILALQGGILNDLLLAVGIIKEPVFWLGTPSLFKPMIIILDIWKDSGWGAIIYMAAIAGIDEQLYEAARVDGAGRFRQIINITIPMIIPTIIIMLILRCGAILDAGFDQVLVFRNPITHDVANILDIFVYDTGLKQGRFGYASAVGLFKSVVGFIMVFSANKVASKAGLGFW